MPGIGIGLSLALGGGSAGWSEAAIAGVLAGKGLSDGDARAAIGGAASLAAGLRAVGLLAPAATPAPVPAPVVSGPTGFALNGSTNPALKAMVARVKAGSGRGRIVIKGDSTTVGDGGGNAQRTDGARQNRWPAVMASLLSAAGVPAVDLAVMGTNNIQNSPSTLPTYDPRVSMGTGTPWIVNGTGATNSAISQQFAGGSWLTSGALAGVSDTNAHPADAAHATFATDRKFGVKALSGGFAQAAALPQASGYAVAMWVRGSGTPALRVFMGQERLFWVGSWGDGRLRARYGSGDDQVTTSVALEDDGWHWIVFQFGTKGATLWCDGAVVGRNATALNQTTATGSLPSPDWSGGQTNGLTIGRLGGDNSYAWNGTIDEVALFGGEPFAGDALPVPSAPYAGTETAMLRLYHLDGDGTDATGTASLTNCLTLTESCDRFEVVVYDTTAGSAIGFWLDGVAVTPVGDPGLVTANSGGFKTYTIAAASAGTHTLAVGATAGAVDLRSIRPWTSATPAIDVLVHASCAAVSGDQAYSNGQNRNQESLALDAPDLTIVFVGLNDMNTGVSAATFSTNLGAIIDKAKATGDVLVVGAYRGTAGFDGAAIRAAAASVASARKAAFLDLDAWYDGVVPPAMFDVVHRTAAGYADMGNAIRRGVMAMAS